MQFFCPACFAPLAHADQVCPRCGLDPKTWHEGRPFSVRLIRALKHPLAETRMMAILTLGNRREPEAAVPLAECAFDHPLDVVQGLEIVRSVENLPRGRERNKAIEMLSGHPARAIRQAARKLTRP